MTNFIIIAGVVIAVLKAMLGGNIQSIEVAGFILLVIVLLLAAGTFKLAKIAALSITVYFFAKEYGLLNAEDIMSFILALLPLFIVLFGLYIILRAPFRK